MRRTNIKGLLFWQELFDANQRSGRLMERWRQSGCIYVFIMTFSFSRFQKNNSLLSLLRKFSSFPRESLPCLTFEGSSIGNSRWKRLNGDVSGWNMNCRNREFTACHIGYNYASFFVKEEKWYRTVVTISLNWRVNVNDECNNLVNGRMGLGRIVFVECAAHTLYYRLTIAFPLSHHCELGLSSTGLMA